MTEQERYLFDLQGYLVVPDALSRAQLQELNASVDKQLAASGQAADAPLFQHMGSLLSWGAGFRGLLDNPRLTPYLEELVDPQFRLDHDYIHVRRRSSSTEGLVLHGGATPYDSSQFYHFQSGRMYNGLTVVAYNLRDVNPGDGGFACVPGSHKANFVLPREWLHLADPAPCVREVPGPAGSAIIFTEALTHGTLQWRSAQERRTLFYKFSPPAISWWERYYHANAYADLTPRQRAILEPPNSRRPERPRALTV